MLKRKRENPEEKSVSEAGHMETDEVQDPAPETRRTRSGRAVRPPAGQPVTTSTRRTRRSVLQELPVEQENTDEPEQKPSEISPEENAEISSETVPEETERTDAGDDDQSGSPDPSAPASTDTTEKVSKDKPRRGSSAKQNPVIPLGKPKSGRVWKDRNKQRFSALLRDKPLCSSWDKKMKAKQEKQLVKQYALQLTEEKAKQKEEKRKRREDNLKRRAENERKAEIVQVIKNTTKIKRMKKKQLRKIEKRDTLAILQKTQKQNSKVKGPKSNAGKELT